MFKDYYAILSVNGDAPYEEIRNAYRAASKRWHPDANPGIDTTQKMQDINEAYAILKDSTKRTRYDAEYKLFKTECGIRHTEPEENEPETSCSYDYEVKDEQLKDDISTARKYAQDLVDEFFSSLKEASKEAAKGAWGAVKDYVIGLFILNIMALIITMIIMAHS